jgi:hypothetical protein
LFKSAAYHLSVGEFALSQTVTNFDALKENTTMDRMGTYKNAKPKPRHVKMKKELR